MSIAASMTTAEIFAMPEDGIERDLIRGELREYPMTKRNRRHSEVMMAVGEVLRAWVRSTGMIGGKVAGGEAGIRLRRDPETLVGVDVAYFSPESVARMADDEPWYDGPPVLAVEILSPSDTHESVVEKVKLYLECGVRMVWILDPDFQTVQIHRSAALPLTFNKDSVLENMPELPGLKVEIREFFA